MDSVHSSGVQNSSCTSTYTMETETHGSKVKRGLGFYKRSNFATSYKRGNKSCSGGNQSVHLNTVYSETGFKRKADFQPKESQSFCRFSEVQDGGSGSSTLTDSTRRPHKGAGSTGRLLFCANSQQSQEISPFCLPRNHLRVSVPTVRVTQRTQDIHETVETSRTITSIPRHTNGDIPR